MEGLPLDSQRGVEAKMAAHLRFRKPMLGVLFLLLHALPAAAYEVAEVQEDITLLPAGNTTADDLARHHYDEAVALYRQGKFRLARVEFQVSYELCKEPDLLHNLSITAERQYLLDDAIAFEEQFLAVKKDLAVEERRLAEVRLTTLRQHRGAAAMASPPGKEPTRRKHYGAAIGLMAGGGALLVVGIGLGGAALATQHTVDAGGLVMSNYDSLVARGNALNGSAIALDCVGGALITSGVVLALVTHFR